MRDNEERIKLTSKECLRASALKRELMCLVFGLSICSANAQVQEPKPECPSKAPALSGLTYDEDDGYLSDPQCRTSSLDSLKYIALPGGNEGYYLSFGVWVRERSEYLNNPGWGSGPVGNPYLMQRYYGHLDLHLGDRFRFFGELGSSIEDGRNGGPHGFDEERLYVHQGFFDIGLVRSGKNKVTLRAGRQEMEYGSHYLVAARDGRNIRRSFDGARLTSLVGKWTVDIFAVRPRLDNRGYFDDPPDHTTSFWGVYAVRPFTLLLGGNIDLYYLGLDDKRVLIDGRGTGQDRTETVGARIWGFKGRWDYNDEYTFQWGTFESDDIRAWAATTEIGYRVDSALFSPRFGIRENAFSGDQNPHGRTAGTFNALYQTGPYFSYAELFGNRNLVVLQPSVALRLTRKITLTPNVGTFWRESTADGLYTSSGALVLTGQKSKAAYVGTQAAAQLHWTINRHVTAFSEYLHFFDGQFVRQSTPGRNLNYVTEWLDFRF
jgi:Alginate export